MIRGARALMAIVMLASASGSAQNGAGESWPTYHGDYSGRHFSDLEQITTANVKNLSLAWVFRMPAPASAIKAIPLMVHGVLYVSTPNHVFAVDARTGSQIWHYAWTGHNAIGNRGVGMFGNWLYVATPDNRIISLDAVTGKERWNRKMVEEKAVNFTSSAPLVIRNHVIVGIGGDGGGSQSFVESLDPETGASQWKWLTTPGRGEPGVETWPSPEAAALSAGAPWQPPSYDATLNLLYVTTGQPTPTYNGAGRAGDNLYTCSVVALNPDTGRMAWFYQFSPHDTHDWDATQVPVLFDGVVDGQLRKLLALANRNGYFFVLDRTTGKNLVVKRFAASNAYLGIDNGRLVPNPAKEGSRSGSLVFPDSDGAANYPAPSFSPDTGLFYVNATDAASIFYAGRDSEWHLGLFTSRLMALDYRTGEMRWQQKYPETAGFWSSTHPGILTTAGGLLFSGDPSGNFIAFDAGTGKILWHAGLGAALTNSPQTFALDARQYVVIAAGDSLYGFVLQ
jgi:acido-empty-quinoprotein group A